MCVEQLHYSMRGLGKFEGEIIIFSQARNLKEYRIERIYESAGAAGGAEEEA